MGQCECYYTIKSEFEEHSQAVYTRPTRTLHKLEAPPPSNLSVTAASQLDVPAGITPEQLEMLLNNLLQNDEKLPYSFHIEEQVR